MQSQSAGPYQRAFKNNFGDGNKSTFRGETEFFDFRRIHDRLDRAEQYLDDQFSRYIFAHSSGALSFREQFFEMPLNQLGPAAFHHLEHVWRFLAHIAYERWFDLV